MNQHDKRLFAFLLGNMKQMEIELRAQSIVLEALASKVVTVEQIGGALTMARGSESMLRLIAEKYALAGKSHLPENREESSSTKPENGARPN